MQISAIQSIWYATPVKRPVSLKGVATHRLSPPSCLRLSPSNQNVEGSAFSQSNAEERVASSAQYYFQADRCYDSWSYSQVVFREHGEGVKHGRSRARRALGEQHGILNSSRNTVTAKRSTPYILK